MMDVQLKLYLYKGLMFKLYVRCAPGAGRTGGAGECIQVTKQE